MIQENNEELHCKPIPFNEKMISLLVPCSTQYSIPACVAAIHYVFTACFSMDLVLRYRVFKPMFMSAGFIYVLLAKTTPLGLLHSTLRSCTALPSSTMSNIFLTTLFRRNEIDYILDTINYPDSNNYQGHYTGQ